MKAIRRKLKPNGKPDGVFVISIDDGYVEYAFELSLKCRPYDRSITKVYNRIRKLFGSKEDAGQMRTQHYDLK